MKVHLAGLPSPLLEATANAFARRGDAVTRGEELPPDADLTLWSTGHEALRHLRTGLAVLDLRAGDAVREGGWAAYADLCLVSHAQDRATLVEMHGCEPERVFMLAGDEPVLELLDRAVRDELPPAPREKGGKEMPAPATGPALTGLAARLELIERHADIRLRDYRVRSRIPLFGPLVAWLRRNLTSHLREPYLDPTLERQVAVNRELAAALREVLRAQEELAARLARLEEERDA